MATSKEWADSLITQFEGRTTPGTWLHVTRSDLAASLRERLAFPDHINQGNTNLCGVAVVVRDWVIDDPVGYVWMAICLFELGYGTFSRGGQSGRVIKPTQEIRASPLVKSPGEKISSADWIVLASLRNDLNLVLDYGPDEGWLFFSDARAWNFPGDVIALFKGSGYKYIRDYTTGISRVSIDHLERASQYFAANYKIVLMIDWRLLYEKEQNNEAVFATSNHFVGLTSPVTIDPRRENVQFDVFSWGQTMPVPEKGPWMPVKTLHRHYYGFIAAKF